MYGSERALSPELAVLLTLRPSSGFCTAMEAEGDAAAAPADVQLDADVVVLSSDSDVEAKDATPGETGGEDEDEAEEEDWETDLVHALEPLSAPGDFACSGVVSDLPAFTPAVTVAGVGRLALPLCPEQAVTLRAASEPAPYGKGHATVLDDTVRRARQVPASKVSIAKPWKRHLSAVVKHVVAQMGVGDAEKLGIEAQLDKLVLYEPGGFFLPHKDTEKAAGMFATLVVQLPCVGGHEGGLLRIRHGSKRFDVDFAAFSKQDALPYTAFFADCTHELKEVTAGMRLALLYNIVRTTPGPPPRPIDNEPAQMALRAAAEAWARAGSGARLRAAVRLEHQYTPGSLDFGSLKGRDATLVGALLACPLLDVRLALATRTETGEAWGSKRRRRCAYDDDDEYYDDDDGEGATMASVDEKEENVEWVAPDGREDAPDFLEPLSEDDLLIGDETLFDDDPDERQYEGYQGNYGPTLTFTYHSCSVVFWLATNTPHICVRGHVDGAAERLHWQPGDALLLNGIMQCAEAAPDVVSARTLGHVLAVLPRVPDAADAAAAGLTILKLLASRYGMAPPFPRNDKDAKARAATAAIKVAREVAVFAAHFAGDDVAAALRFLVEKCHIKDTRACCELVTALAGCPAMHAAAAGPLEALLTDHTAFLALVPDAAAPLLRTFLPSAEAMVVNPDSARAVLDAFAACGLAAVPKATLKQVAEVAFSPNGLRCGAAGVFADAVLASNPGALSTLLTAPAVTAAVTARDAAATRLLSACINELQAVAARGPPPHSWEQPDALFPANASVEAFLRGPKQQFYLSGCFLSIACARAFAEKHFCAVPSYGRYGQPPPPQRSFDATATAGGRGDTAYVSIVKGNGIHQRRLKQHVTALEELARLRALRGPAAA